MLALAFGVILHAVTLNTGGAASLNGYPTVVQEFEERYAVFTGTVLSEHHEPATKYFDQAGTTYEVRVDELFKGRSPRSIRLFSENSDAEFPMTVGTKYLLFVYRDHGRLLVDSCGNSEHFSSTSKALRTVQKLTATK